MFERLKKIFTSTKQPDIDRARPSSMDEDGVLINAYCTNARVPEIDFAHVLNSHRDLSDPELSHHLNGFIGYVHSNGDGEMSRTKYHVIRHIQRVQNHLSFSVSEGLLDSVSDWAGKANAILFIADGSIRDIHGRILIPGDDAAAEPEAEIPYPIEAWQRKARTEALLAAKGLSVPSHLPPLVSEPELRLRTQQQVAGRALALFIAAVRAESVASNEAIPVEQLLAKFPHAQAYISPNEELFLNKESVSPSETTQFTWRYESLFLLQWALGLYEKLPFPSYICNVPEVARNAMENGTEVLHSRVQLRQESEILDALDLHYRLHWLVRQAQLEEKPLPTEVNAGVIQERHYALNWLVRFENNEWDEVDTPT